MRIEVSIEGDFSQLLKREVRLVERAVQHGIDAGGTQLQADWRAQIVAAKLGTTLPKTIRKKTFPKSGNSINAASLVYSNASKCAFRRIRPVVPTTSGQSFRSIRSPEERCRVGMVF